MDNFKITTLIVGKTLSNALVQLNNVYQKYREYGIKLTDSEVHTGILILYFDNNEKMFVTTFSHLQEPQKGCRFNNIYFDKELPQKEFFDFIKPLLKSSSSMWQF